MSAIHLDDVDDLSQEHAPLHEEVLLLKAMQLHGHILEIGQVQSPRERTHL